MSNLITPICKKASIEEIKANLDENKHDKGYINLVNRFGNNALILACMQGYTEAVKLLLEEGADMNIVDEDGDTALIWACFYNRIESVKLLLQYNANVKIVGKDGMTALMIAELYGRTEIVKLLNTYDNYAH